MVRTFSPDKDKDLIGAIIRALKKLVAAGKLLTGFGFTVDSQLLLTPMQNLSESEFEEIIDAIIDELGRKPLAAEYLERGSFLDPATVPALSFFAGELRPGAGIVRVENNHQAGPRGCCGLLLKTIVGGQDSYFLTAGHLVSETWSENDLGASIHRSRNSGGANDRALFLGWVVKISPVTKAQNWNKIDAALVEVGDVVPVDPRTTCFGPFLHPATDIRGKVTKCGNEEPIWTDGEIVCPRYWVAVQRDGNRYLFEEQILVRSSFNRPFAKPGDSGCIVAKSGGDDYGAIVGMLMAGSVLRDVFVLNPITALVAFWDGFKPQIALEVQNSSDQKQESVRASITSGRSSRAVDATEKEMLRW